MLSRLLRFALPCLPLLCLPSTLGGQAVALRGTVVTPAGPLPGATLLVDAGRIAGLGLDLRLPPGIRVVETGGTIYPGLIDLHNHVTWNALARWHASSKSGARYDWQQLPEYQMALNVPHSKMVREGHGCAAERYAEAKALIGGATAQAGLSAADLTGGLAGAAGCLGGLARELGVSSRLYPAGTAERLRYEVFPLALDTASVSAIVNGLRDGSLNAALFHIAEGAAEDASARREFGMLKARGLLVPGVSIIHGVALTPANFEEMAKAKVGLVWSPRSNFELYGSTADVLAAKQAGVTIAIAPDWSPTGSDGMLQELKYAATWNATQEPSPFTDRDLFEMATVQAAKLGGIAGETGTLVPGMRADLLVLSGASAAVDPYAALVHSSPGEVALVMVDGVAVYGDQRLLEAIRPAGNRVPLSVCGRPKQLAVPTVSSWEASVAELADVLGRWGASLSPLGQCF